MAYGPLVTKVFSTAIVAGVPATVWTPASGKKFRLTGWTLSPSVATFITFKDNAASLNVGTANLAINTPSKVTLPGDGVVSSTADNPLKLDVGANATVTGMVWGYEE
jgi:hypothetical protein